VRVRWSLLARQDLQALRAYIAQDNPPAANDVARRIMAAANRLVRYPYLGRPGRLPGSRELVVPRTPYLLIYVVGEQRVDVVRVLHGAQRWPR
jgi:addiction module RelE/StbE family toxin